MPVIGVSRATQADELSAGSRTEWVTVERFTEQTTPSKIPGGTWAEYARVPMSRRTQAADERITASIPSAYLSTVWTTRYRPDLDPDLVDVPKYRRLVLDGRRYDIKAADLIGRRRGIELLTLAASKV